MYDICMWICDTVIRAPHIIIIILIYLFFSERASKLYISRWIIEDFYITWWAWFVHAWNRWKKVIFIRNLVWWFTHNYLLRLKEKNRIYTHIEKRWLNEILKFMVHAMRLSLICISTQISIRFCGILKGISVFCHIRWKG